jgi:hypothetical protein
MTVECSTYVVDIHVLVVAGILILGVSRDNELVTGRDRNLQSVINHHNVDREFRRDLRLGHSA